MLQYDFMVNAFLATFLVAVASGLVGSFLVLRGQSFAGHALSHVGFTGATGAVLVGLPPLYGLILVTLAAGLGMGALDDRLQGRDVAIGMVLTVALGLGLLFLHFFTAYAAQTTTLLFGNALAVDRSTVWTLLGLTVAVTGGLGGLARPLLFASVQPELAEARGVRSRRLSMLFLGLAALATSACAQVVGVLLVFTLMIGPAASAQWLARRFGQAAALAVGLALVEAWLGLTLAYYTDWPTSFWITLLSGAVYLLAMAAGTRRTRTHR